MTTTVRRVVDVTSWREAASAQVQDDLDGMLGAALDLAERNLSAHGEFYPYAIGLGISGEMQMIVADPGEVGDQPASADVVVACRDAVAARRGALRAAAVVSDVRVAAIGGDAVRVEMEHVDGIALTVVMPYTRAGGSVVYGQPTASAGGRTGLSAG